MLRLGFSTLFAGLILLLLPMVASAAILPQRAKLQYVDNHGIPVSMDFNQQNNQYRIDVNLNLILYHLNFVSTGTINKNTLTPLSYVDTRQGKPYVHANFSKHVVEFGRNGTVTKQIDVDGPVYDMFSLGWQLGINNGQLAKNIYLTNGKKLYTLNSINYIGKEQVSVNNELITIIQYHLNRGNDVMEYAFAPSLGGIPVRISYMDNGKLYSLHFKSGQIDGKVIKTL